MAQPGQTIRAPVIRAGAQHYLLLSLVAFGGSVVLTRLFLQLTGYPKIGGGQLHIAHVLWGGLLLFIAALLPLIFANRWVYPLGAVSCGVGVGLFIDEVGKFITMNNDYFFPPAAPIIYALFLLTVLVYLRVRKVRPNDPRDNLYHVLDSLTEILDRDLEPSERADLHQKLGKISADATHPDLANLAHTLNVYLENDHLSLAPERDSYLQKAGFLARRLERRYISRWRLRIALIMALGILGAVALVNTFSVVLPAAFNGNGLESILLAGFLSGDVRSAAGASWYMIHLTLRALIGLLILFAAGLITAGKERRGIELAILAIVLNLTLVNLLAFFINQFSAVIGALVNLLVYLGLRYYSDRYLN